MPWIIKNAAGDTLAKSTLFFSLPLSEYFPHSGFSEAVTHDLEFTFELDGITVSWEAPTPVAPRVPTAAETLKALEYAVTMHIDGVAAGMGYGLEGHPMTATISLASYAGDPNPKYAADAAKFKPWRSEVWTKCFEIMAAVQAGDRGIPTEAGLLSELPPYPEA